VQAFECFAISCGPHTPESLWYKQSNSTPIGPVLENRGSVVVLDENYFFMTYVALYDWSQDERRGIRVRIVDDEYVYNIMNPMTKDL